MIFGFNTDIRHDDIVYHVQSEAREGEQLLQTQVFVRGRCIGKRAISYALGSAAEKVGERKAALSDSGSADPGDRELDAVDVNAGDVNGDQYKEKLLRDLHRQVLDAIREGRLDSVLDKRDAPDVLASVKELDLQWTNAESVHSQGALMMNILVTEAGAPVAGARLTFRFSRPSAAPYYAQVLTNDQGRAEMSFQVGEDSLPDSSVLVQATFGGRTATRKFRVRPTN
ncbi:MAG: hypothetical protein WA172_22210 [Terriglobales bacterium]